MAVPPGSLISAVDLSRRYGRTTALDHVSVEVAGGEIHALLGRNGAGKTTLLRVLTGLLTPTAGAARVAGIDVSGSPRELRRAVALVPSGDRSFYLRISGLENLVFFGRLRGLRRREARARALAAMSDVGLDDSARAAVGKYSHGMQKRLSIARALMADPAVLLVDEATHDLDPEGAREVRALVRGVADRGAAVLWATQRVDEIRGLADGLTLLDRGAVRFAGTVTELLARRPTQRYVLALRNGSGDGRALEDVLADRLAPVASIVHRQRGDEFVLSLADGAVLGDALARLLDAGVTLVSCREEVSELEEAFVHVLESEEPS